MTGAHLSAIMVHEEELFGTESWTVESYRDELADHRHRFYICAVGEVDAVGAVDGTVAAPEVGPVLGWAGLLTIADTAQIVTIGVATAAQRRGIGQLMLDHLLAEATRRGAVEAILEVRVDNDSARLLYEKNGFIPLRTRRGYYELGRVDALEMRREL